MLGSEALALLPVQRPVDFLALLAAIRRVTLWAEARRFFRADDAQLHRSLVDVSLVFLENFLHRRCVVLAACGRQPEDRGLLEK